MESLTIQGKLPGLNKMIDKAKSHHMAYANLKKEYTNKVAWQANNLSSFQKVYLNITYYCQSRLRDQDNIAAGKKFLIDGLVKAGVIEDDGWDQIKGWSESFKRDKDNPRIEVEIIEIGE